MKKFLQIWLLVAIITCAIKSTVTAQLADKNYLVSVEKIKNYLAFEEKMKVEGALDPKDAARAAKASFKALKANSRASENFKKQFKNAGNVSWSSQEDVIVGSFTKDEMKTNVIYDKNGRWIHTLQYSDERTMPEKVRSTVEDSYPGYDISLCVEVHEGINVFHVVQIENKRMFKQLGISNGEVNEISVYRKNVH